jgi:acyl-CoA reductase-like NAD-dependent aldehyde dehydrogenase
MPVDGPDEAVRVANDSDYGLSAEVFSEDVPAALEEFTELRWITVQWLKRDYPI